MYMLMILLCISILSDVKFCSALYTDIDPFMITAVLHSSGTFVSGNNTLCLKMMSENN
jgi:hypothetical protein